MAEKCQILHYNFFIIIHKSHAHIGSHRGGGPEGDKLGLHNI